MWKPRQALARLALTAMLCAGPAAARTPGTEEPAVLRGAETAQARCSGCHAVALETEGPAANAPLFRVLSRLYPADRLRAKLLDISKNGHFQMPPVEMSQAEASDLAAYIASLDGGAAH